MSSLRSTYWTLLGTAVAMIGFGALFAARYGVEPVTPADRSTFNPTAYGLSGFFLAQLAVGVLGVLVITSEYSTGSIRTTLSAVPQRLHLLGAKAATVGSITAAVGVAVSVATFYVNQRVFASKDISVSLSDPNALRAVVGAGLYLGVLSLLALGLGTLIRGTAAATATVVALVFVFPGLSAALPTGWQDTIVPYMPSFAGQAVIGHTKFAPSTPHLLAPWSGFGVLCVYAVAVLSAAAMALVRRDSR